MYEIEGFWAAPGLRYASPRNQSERNELYALPFLRLPNRSIGIFSPDPMEAAAGACAT